jgi:hypothetical protein
MVAGDSERGKARNWKLDEPERVVAYERQPRKTYRTVSVPSPALYPTRAIEPSLGPKVNTVRAVIPLSRRPLDAVLIGFFVFNFAFITYTFDVEQVLILDTSNFEYPLWPPAAVIDLAHWYGRTWDPALLARPAWWRATIWIDLLVFGPFYAAAIYAYWKGKDWIRIPSVMWASIMMTNVTIILFEEVKGTYASDSLGMVFGANASWFVVPIIVLARMWNAEHPFTEAVGEQRH